MIYDPARAAHELRHRILESMTARELEEYASQSTKPEKRMREQGKLSLGIWNIDVEVEFDSDRKGGRFYPVPLTADVVKMLTKGTPTLTVGDESFMISHIVQHPDQAATSGYLFERIHE